MWADKTVDLSAINPVQHLMSSKLSSDGLGGFRGVSATINFGARKKYHGTRKTQQQKFLYISIPSSVCGCFGGSWSTSSHLFFDSKIVFITIAHRTLQFN